MRKIIAATAGRVGNRGVVGEAGKYEAKTIGNALLVFIGNY